MTSSQPNVLNSPILMPDVCMPLTSEKHAESWLRVIPKLQVADTIFTFRTKSFRSKLIAGIDSGSWSHTAIYIGNGDIVEAIGEGVVKRSIEIYNDPTIRLGVYRPFIMTEIPKEKVVASAFEKLGVPYGHVMLIRLGLMKLFCPSKLKPGEHPRDTSPNDIIYLGVLYLVDYV
jgi:hypothetical protein